MTNGPPPSPAIVTLGLISAATAVATFTIAIILGVAMLVPWSPFLVRNWSTGILCLTLGSIGMGCVIAMTGVTWWARRRSSASPLAPASSTSASTAAAPHPLGDVPTSRAAA